MVPIVARNTVTTQVEEELQMGDHVGQQLGHYRLTRLLGEGGFAAVYLGEHIHLGTPAAIKLLGAQLTNDQIEHFRTEARTIAHLQHPNIVRVLDFGIEDRTPFLVMSYASHGSLRQRHPKGTRLSLPTVVTYVNPMAAALQYAHQQRLVHCDVKPDNMLVGQHNELLLSDFGIAVIFRTTLASLQQAQRIGGTPFYMAPEQFKGRPYPASDQYALAVVVYEWLCGDPPFPGGTFIQLGYQHTCEAPHLCAREFRRSHLLLSKWC